GGAVSSTVRLKCFAVGLSALVEVGALSIAIVMEANKTVPSRRIALDFVTSAGLNEGFIRNLVKLMVFLGIARRARQFFFMRVSVSMLFDPFSGKILSVFVPRDLRWIHGDRVLTDDLLLLSSGPLRQTHSHEVIRQRNLNKR